MVHKFQSGRGQTKSRETRLLTLTRIAFIIQKYIICISLIINDINHTTNMCGDFLVSLILNSCVEN